MSKDRVDKLNGQICEWLSTKTGKQINSQIEIRLAESKK